MGRSKLCWQSDTHFQNYSNHIAVSPPPQTEATSTHNVATSELLHMQFQLCKRSLHSSLTPHAPPQNQKIESCMLGTVYKAHAHAHRIKSITNTLTWKDSVLVMLRKVTKRSKLFLVYYCDKTQSSFPPHCTRFLILYSSKSNPKHSKIEWRNLARNCVNIPLYSCQPRPQIEKI